MQASRGMNTKCKRLYNPQPNFPFHVNACFLFYVYGVYGFIPCKAVVSLCPAMDAQQAVLYALITICICMLFHRAWLWLEQTHFRISQRFGSMNRILDICRELQERPQIGSGTMLVTNAIGHDRRRI